MSAQPKLRAVPGTLPDVTDDILLCRNRSIGHDWGGGTTRWVEGERVAGRGRKKYPVYVTYAVTDCPRCGTVRREVFEQHGEDYLIKLANRYKYPPEWKLVPQLSQSELQTARWRRDRA